MDHAIPPRFVDRYRANRAGWDNRPYYVVQDDGCWRWVRAIANKGYGITAWKYDDGTRQAMVAHRAFYMAFVGPIPEGYDIDHLCSNRWCVRPDHLEAVTHQVNIDRGRQGKRTHCRNGHLYSLVLRPEQEGCKGCYMRSWRMRRLAEAAELPLTMDVTDRCG